MNLDSKLKKLSVLIITVFMALSYHDNSKSYRNGLSDLDSDIASFASQGKDCSLISDYLNGFGYEYMGDYESSSGSFISSCRDYIDIERHTRCSAYIQNIDNKEGGAFNELADKACALEIYEYYNSLADEYELIRGDSGQVLFRLNGAIVNLNSVRISDPQVVVGRNGNLYYKVCLSGIGDDLCIRRMSQESANLAHLAILNSMLLN